MFTYRQCSTYSYKSWFYPGPPNHYSFGSCLGVDASQLLVGASPTSLIPFLPSLCSRGTECTAVSNSYCNEPKTITENAEMPPHTVDHGDAMRFPA